MAINPKVIDIYHGDGVAPDGFVQARAFGILGVIHKASEGSATSDATYARRRTMAKDAGLLWGAYHFIRPIDTSKQVDLFLRTSQPDQDTLLALDYEVDSVGLDQARDFIEQVESRVGRSVVLYSGNTIKEKLGNRIDPWWGAHRLWLAQYGSNPRVPPSWAKAWLWQYTGDGQGLPPHQVPGIQGDGGIDISHWDGMDDELRAQWAGVAAVAAARPLPPELRAPVTVGPAAPVGARPTVAPPVAAGPVFVPPVIGAPALPPPVAGAPVREIETTVVRAPQQQGAAALGQLLAALGQLNATLARLHLPQAGAATSTPILSPIDKALGGEAMVGLKTPLALAAYAALWIMQSVGTIGTATGDKATTTGQVMTALIAAFGGLGLTAKLDRWVKAINAVAAAQPLPAASSSPPKT
jgi:GH25 family lysozyme M1 (1,4-beta-N-acetylmuramidase)